MLIPCLRKVPQVANLVLPPVQLSDVNSLCQSALAFTIIEIVRTESNRYNTTLSVSGIYQLIRLAISPFRLQLLYTRCNEKLHPIAPNYFNDDPRYFPEVVIRFRRRNPFFVWIGYFGRLASFPRWSFW